MDRQKINKTARTIEIKANSKREFFLLHGYTGSPTDFNKLGEYLNKRFNANVKIIRLKGHGENIENLDKLKYRDFLLQAEEELKRDIKLGKEIIIGGVSVGSFLALQLSEKYPVKGILNFAIPYKPKFPLGIISFFEPIIFKKCWKKPIAKDEREMIKNAFFYDIHISGFRIIKEAKKELKYILNKINVPSFILHIAKDKVFSAKGAIIVKNKINSKINELIIFKTKKKVMHNPFFSEDHNQIYSLVGNFVSKNKLFNK